MLMAMRGEVAAALTMWKRAVVGAVGTMTAVVVVGLGRVVVVAVAPATPIALVRWLSRS
jgi:hypothetical protein